MSHALNMLSSLRDAAAKMKICLAQRKSDDILEQARAIEQMILPLRDIMAVITDAPEEEKRAAKTLLSETRKLCKTNMAISSTLGTLLRSTLAHFSGDRGPNSTYGRNTTPDSASSPLLVNQQG
jgi:hypothetical protein